MTSQRKSINLKEEATSLVRKVSDVFTTSSAKHLSNYMELLPKLKETFCEVIVKDQEILAKPSSFKYL